MSRTKRKKKTRGKDAVNKYPSHSDSCPVCKELDEFYKKQNRQHKNRKRKLTADDQLKE